LAQNIKRRSLARSTLQPSGRVSLWAAIVSACLYWAAFPPVGLFPLAFVALAPLLNQAPGLKGWKRFLIGWFHFSLVHLMVFYWIVGTVQRMGGVGEGLSLLILLLYALFHGLMGGVFLWGLGRLGHDCGPLRFSLIAAGLFCLLEAIWPSVFPWYLGNALYRSPILLQLADLGGVHVLSFLMVFTAAYLARRLPPHGPLDRGNLKRIAITIGLVLSGILAYGGMRWVQYKPTSKGTIVRIGIVQPMIHAVDKMHASETTRQRILEQTWAQHGLLPRDLDLIVWPEGGFPFFFQQSPSEKLPISHRATTRFVADIQRGATPLFVGALTQSPTEGQHNSAILIDPDGSTQVYHKQRLVPFGETLPLRSLVPGAQKRFRSLMRMRPGKGPGVFQIGEHRFIAQICYETIFPAGTRSDIRHTNPDFILNLTNDVWFGNTAALELHLMAQAIRAVETRRTLVRATNTGISALVDPRGTISNRTPVFEATSQVFAFRPLIGDSPFLRFGNLFLYLIFALVVGLYFGPVVTTSIKTRLGRTKK